MTNKFIDEEKINASVLREEQLKKAKEKPKSEIMLPMLLTAIIVPIFGIYAFFHHVNVFLTNEKADVLQEYKEKASMFDGLKDDYYSEEERLEQEYAENPPSQPKTWGGVVDKFNEDFNNIKDGSIDIFNDIKNVFNNESK